MQSTLLAQPLNPVQDSLRAALSSLFSESSSMSFTESKEWSHSLTEVEFSGGRKLIVKRARYDWEGPRFLSSRVAARLLNKRTGVIAPEHVDVLANGELSMEAYWRIDLPTLKELWPAMTEKDQSSALRSWGELMRRVHKVRLRGHGFLPTALQQPSSLANFLSYELGERLAPAVEAHWPEALPLVGELLESVEELCGRVGEGEGVLLHNDMHMANVLCGEKLGRLRCVGVIDLEAAYAGPAESDLAHTQVLHGPLFGQPLQGDWFKWIEEGYGRALDQFALTFFRAFHMLNLGFHEALTGFDAHASLVAEAIEEEVRLLKQPQAILA